MALDLLEIWNIRAIEHACAELHPQRNVFIGPNASGKTSLLESVYLLATARSFRPGPANTWLRSGEGGWRVMAQVRDANGARHTLGIERTGGKRVLRLDNQDQSSIAPLAGLLPVQVLTPEGHYAFLSDPSERRRALSWGLFHVEPQFLATWRQYQRALQQRNAALRLGLASREFTAWDSELISAGERLEGWYQQYVERWQAIFAHLSESLLGPGATLALARGWPPEMTFADALRNSRDADGRMGFTQFGPHRADVRVKWEDSAARWRGSHGQQKLLVLAARLAQAVITTQSTGRRTTLLIDDLAAELDVERRKMVLSLIADLPAQALVTAIGPDVSLDTWADAVVFHVERGRVTCPKQA